MFKPVLFAVAIFGVILGLLLAVAAEQREWQDYAVAHHCRAVGKREWQAGGGYPAGQTIYACDAGEIQIR